MKTTFGILKTAFREWNQDKAARMAAAVAYYGVFSLAPLLIVVIGVVGLLVGPQAAEGQLIGQIQGVVGAQGAALIQSVIASASHQGTGIIATVIGLATTLLGASGAFAQLQDSFNTIWEVMPRPGRPIWWVLRDRLQTFAMVLGAGCLLLVSLALRTLLSALNGALGGLLPVALPWIWPVANELASALLAMLAIGLVFKYLPDVKIGWRDVIAGAAFTAVALTAGKYALGLYLGHAGVNPAYGAAGSLVVLLLWIYYSAQILLLGAEFTQAYARRDGRPIVPRRGAVPMSEAVRMQQGIPHT